MAGDEEGRRTGERRADRSRSIPDELRQRLAPWIDLDEVGMDGFWLWLETVLPALPPPHRVSRVMRDARRGEASAERVQELARDLVDCAADRAKLTINGQRYYIDNQLLARRVKALEAILRTLRAAGHPVTVPVDDEAATAGERYLPRP